MRHIRAKQESLAAEYKTAYNDLVAKLIKMLEREIRNGVDKEIVDEYAKNKENTVNFINKFFIFNLQSDGQYRSFTLQIDIKPKLKADDKKMGAKLKNLIVEQDKKYNNNTNNNNTEEKTDKKKRKFKNRDYSKSKYRPEDEQVFIGIND